MAAAASSAVQRLRLLDLPLPRLRELLVAEGRPPFRAAQLWDHVYRRGVGQWDAMTNLPAADRAWLGQAMEVGLGTLAAGAESSDGTRKWLYRCSSSAAAAAASAADAVECVYIPDAATRRGTVCVSSQAGCTLACAFCRTGTQALRRNLRAGDVVGQVLAVRGAVEARRDAWAEARAGGRPLPSALPPPPVNRVVLMGEGEPLFNYSAVLTALRVLCDPHASGLAVAPHHVTLSTAGVAPLLGRLAEESPGPGGVRLAVSLHAPNDALRSRLMDINARWPMGVLLPAVAEYARVSLERRRREAGVSVGAVKGLEAEAAADAERAGGGAGADAEADDGDEDGEEDALLLGRHGGGGGGGSGGGRGRATGTGPSRALRDAAESPAQRHNGRGRLRVSFEYVGLEANTRPGHAGELVAALAAHLPRGLCHVNLINFNPWEGAGGGATIEAAAASRRGAGTGAALPKGVVGLSDAARADVPLVAPAPPAQLAAFQRALMSAGIRTTVRSSRGQDILGACGQLRSDGAAQAAAGVGVGAGGARGASLCGGA